MRRLLLALPLLACFAFAACTSEPEIPPEQSIESSFRALQRACVAKDGEAALALLAAPTREHWVRIKGLALNAPKDELRRQGIVMQLYVLVLRAKAGFEGLEALDEAGLIQYALDNGLFGGQLVVGNALRDLEVDGDHATSAASHEASGRELNVRYDFEREADGWKVDLVPAYTIANDVMHAKLSTEGFEDEEEALYFLVGNATGTGGTPELWIPLSDRIGD